MNKLATSVAVLGLTASAAFAGGYVAPVINVEPVVVEEQAASSNAGLVVPALLLLGVVAAVAADDSDDSTPDNGGGMSVIPDTSGSPASVSG